MDVTFRLSTSVCLGESRARRGRADHPSRSRGRYVIRRVMAWNGSTLHPSGGSEGWEGRGEDIDLRVTSAPSSVRLPPSRPRRSTMLSPTCHCPHCPERMALVNSPARYRSRSASPRASQTPLSHGCLRTPLLSGIQPQSVLLEAHTPLTLCSSTPTSAPSCSPVLSPSPSFLSSSWPSWPSQKVRPLRSFPLGP